MKFLKSGQRPSLKALSDAFSETRKDRTTPTDSILEPEQPNMDERKSHSAPPVYMMPKPCLEKRIDLLDDTQLTQLTRSNTKRNLGSRKRRFRSQIERVCRKLDNFAIDAKLQPRFCMDAIPVVRPQCAGPVDAVASHPDDASSEPSEASQSESVHDKPQKCADREPSPMSSKCSADVNGAGEIALGSKRSSEDTYAIEPATNDSVFSTNTFSTRSMMSNGQPKSVRISASVVVLDYKSDAQPVSVSTLERFDHPTRNDKNALLRRANAQDVAFRQARIRRLAGALHDAHNLGNHYTNDASEAKPSKETLTSPCSQASPSSRTTTPRSMPNVAFATPTPGGPYGPPLPK